MNEVHAETGGVTSGRMPHIISKLIFLLVAQDGKIGNRGHELIVAKGLEARDGLRGGTERESQGVPKIRIARFRVMKAPGIKCERAKPRGTEGELLVQKQIQVIRM